MSDKIYPIFPSVSKSQANKADDLYRERGSTAESVGVLMGWHEDKVRRVIRILHRYGSSAFAEERSDLRR
jgi:hypothetical protein